MKDKRITLPVLAGATVLLVAAVSTVLFKNGRVSEGTNHDETATENSPRRAASDDDDDSDDRANGFGPPIILRLASMASDSDLTSTDAPATDFNLDAPAETAPLLTEAQWTEYLTANLVAPAATDSDDALPRLNTGQTAREQDAILSADDFEPSSDGSNGAGR